MRALSDTFTRLYPRSDVDVIANVWANRYALANPYQHPFSNGYPSFH